MPPLDLYYRIKSGKLKVNKFSPLEHRFWIKVDKDGPIHPAHGRCWGWKGNFTRYGYGRIVTKDNHHISAHRYSWILKNGSVEEGMCVLHKCDNRFCTNPDHLFLGTRKDNNQDCIRKGRNSRGEQRHNCILTEDDVKAIRAEYRQGVVGRGYRQLARKYGVTPLNIRKVVLRESWKHII